MGKRRQATAISSGSPGGWWLHCHAGTGADRRPDRRTLLSLPVCRCQTVGAVCPWWRQVAMEAYLLPDLNLNCLPLFAQASSLSEGGSVQMVCLRRHCCAGFTSGIDAPPTPSVAAHPQPARLLPAAGKLHLLAHAAPQDNQVSWASVNGHGNGGQASSTHACLHAAAQNQHASRLLLHAYSGAGSSCRIKLLTSHAACWAYMYAVAGASRSSAPTPPAASSSSPSLPP